MNFRKLLLVKKELRRFYDIHIKKDQKVVTYYEYLNKGGEELGLDYPIGSDDVVIDAGGYLGDFAADVVSKFDCRVEVFEPVERFVAQIRERLSGNSKVIVVQAGLGASERYESIAIAGLGSSIFNSGYQLDNTEVIRIISAVDYIRAKGYAEIALLKINIEGGEYEVLESLLEQPDVLNIIKYLQIQFHDFIPDAVNKRAGIQKRLSETHELMWDFPFIWESWARISS